MRLGRIPYVNCYPVYGAIDRGLVPIDAILVDGVPTDLNARMAAGSLDMSVVSAVEYARHRERYFLLPDLAISCDGPVRSVLLLSRRPATELGGRDVMLSRSSMTSVALLELLFEHVWCCAPRFTPGDAELDRPESDAERACDARLVIGDAALQAWDAGSGGSSADLRARYPYIYDLGVEWKRWTGRPFVFAVWVAQRALTIPAALRTHAALLASRDWGLGHLEVLAADAATATGVPLATCATYLSGIDYRLSRAHLDGLTEFLRRLAVAGRVPDGALAFLPAA